MNKTPLHIADYAAFFESTTEATAQEFLDKYEDGDSR
jgi:hypothetical protein